LIKQNKRCKEFSAIRLFHKICNGRVLTRHRFIHMADFNVIGTLILAVKAAAIFASENIFVNTYPHWFNYSS